MGWKELLQRENTHRAEDQLQLPSLWLSRTDDKNKNYVIVIIKKFRWKEMSKFTWLRMIPEFLSEKEEINFDADILWAIICQVPFLTRETREENAQSRKLSDVFLITKLEQNGSWINTIKKQWWRTYLLTFTLHDFKLHNCKFLSPDTEIKGTSSSVRF